MAPIGYVATCRTSIAAYRMWRGHFIVGKGHYEKERNIFVKKQGDALQNIMPFLESHVIWLRGFHFGSVDHAPEVGYEFYVKSISGYFI